MALALEAGRSSTPDAVPAAPARARLTAAEAKDPKDQFANNCPGELLAPSTTPSLAFLSYIKEAVDTKTLGC